MRISKSNKTVKASRTTHRTVKSSWQDKPSMESMQKDLIDDGWQAVDIESLDYNDLYARWCGAGFCDDDIEACGSVKGSTSTDKALQHIKAAIDILGKSGKKDDVTKDSIANLAVVMFDMQSNKKRK